MIARFLFSFHLLIMSSVTDLQMHGSNKKKKKNRSFGLLELMHVLAESLGIRLNQLDLKGAVSPPSYFFAGCC